MNKNEVMAKKVHFVLDRSSSMQELTQSVIEGVSEVVRALPLGSLISTTTFNQTVELDDTETVSDSWTVGDLSERLLASGQTALYDAIVQTVALEVQRNEPDREVHIIVFSDGCDTCSVHDGLQAHGAMQTARDNGWFVQYLTNGTTSESSATEMLFEPESFDVRKVFRATSENISQASAMPQTPRCISRSVTQPPPPPDRALAPQRQKTCK